MQIGPQMWIRDVRALVMFLSCQMEQYHSQANVNRPWHYLVPKWSTWHFHPQYKKRSGYKVKRRELDSDLEATTIKIGCDNQSALALAKTDRFRARSKHIDVRHHYIRDKLADVSIDLEYIPTNRMVADSHTKAVSGPKNNFCAR